MYAFSASNCKKTILVNDEDRELADSHCWYIGKNGYPASRINNHIKYLHRLVMGEPDGLEVDHINGNRLDARRGSLRIVTDAENKQNSPARGGTSIHRGVSWNGNTWVVRYGRRYIGSSVNEGEAAQIAVKWRNANLQFASG